MENEDREYIGEWGGDLRNILRPFSASLTS
ncbi:hypothetical protein A2U01_0102206, partial [Trifolium medium]|nr:hypothetical protein [Trifolium medium]